MKKNQCITNYGFTADKTSLLSLDLTFSENSMYKLSKNTVKLYRTFNPFFPAFVYCHLNWQKIYKVSTVITKWDEEKSGFNRLWLRHLHRIKFVW